MSKVITMLANYSNKKMCHQSHVKHSIMLLNTVTIKDNHISTRPNAYY